ncbi:MAG: hypothetical protein K2H13_05730 [Eubacterium sp.]|nr:hypothetical protein [Eubacterium sp.]MDE6156142.1 hypothetical protein [Eubacterium sp.]
MKKVLSVLLTVILVCSIGVIGVQAAEYDPDRTAWCLIYKNNPYSDTKVVYGTDKYFGGRNTYESEQALHIGAMYYTSDSGYVYNKAYVMPANTALYSTHTTKFNSAKYWKTRIKPVQGSSGCVGSGFIWYT